MQTFSHLSVTPVFPNIFIFTVNEIAKILICDKSLKPPFSFCFMFFLQRSNCFHLFLKKWWTTYLNVRKSVDYLMLIRLSRYLHLTVFRYQFCFVAHNGMKPCVMVHQWIVLFDINTTAYLLTVDYCKTVCIIYVDC